MYKHTKQIQEGNGANSIHNRNLKSIFLIFYAWQFIWVSDLCFLCSGLIGTSTPPLSSIIQTYKSRVLAT